jgi:sugar lactone lactonase YvrE
MVTNSLVLTKDSKTIYFTSSSTNFDLSNGMYELLSSPSGRVLKYDVYGNITKVIMDEISFANGIALSPGEDFLLVCEAGAKRIWKYWLQGI